MAVPLKTELRVPNTGQIGHEGWIIQNPKVKYVFEKGKIDNHFWVRVAANRFNKL